MFVYRTEAITSRFYRLAELSIIDCQLRCPTHTISGNSYNKVHIQTVDESINHTRPYFVNGTKRNDAETEESFWDSSLRKLNNRLSLVLAYHFKATPTIVGEAFIFYL